MLVAVMTCTGEVDEPVPLPSRPSELLPQQKASAARVNAQVW